MAKMTDQTKDKIIEMLESELTVLAVCSKLKLSRQTVYRWINDDKDFAKRVKQAKVDCIQYVNDDCESRILQKIRKDDAGMIKFWLKYRHPDYKQCYILTK